MLHYSVQLVVIEQSGSQLIMGTQSKAMHAHRAFPPRSTLSPLGNTGPKLKGIFWNGSSASSACSRGSCLAATCKPLGEPLELGSLPLP